MSFKSYKNYFCASAIVASTFFALPLTSAVQVEQEKTHAPATDFVGVAKKAIPAVVSIRVKIPSSNSLFDIKGDKEESDLFNDNFWQQFFGVPRGGSRQKSQQDQMGQASGFIVSPNGYILTNNHVVADAKEITAMLVDGREFPAKVIGKDKNTDIAVLKIEAENLPHLQLGDSDELQTGQWAIAIGNPLGLQASLTVGVISATGRDNLDIATIEDFIQTDAAINRGNSGGPLLDMNGEVVGINTAIVSNQGGYMGIGFAIPSNIAQNIMDQLISNGTATRGFIGVTLQKIDQNLALAFKLEKMEGALISDISKGSPAEKSGLRQGDIVLKYNNNTIPHISSLRKAVSFMKPGSKLNLTVLRNGKILEIPIVVGTFPENPASLIAADNKLGFELEDITPEYAEKLGLKGTKGVIITQVRPGSPSYIAGIRPGAVLVAVNQKEVDTVKDVEDILKKSEEGKPILLLVKQGGFTRFVSIKMD